MAYYCKDNWSAISFIIFIWPFAISIITKAFKGNQPGFRTCPWITHVLYLFLIIWFWFI